MGDTADVQALVQGKSALRYSGPDVDAMWELAVAHKNRSLHELESVLEKRKAVLEGDSVIKVRVCFALFVLVVYAFIIFLVAFLFFLLFLLLLGVHVRARPCTTCFSFSCLSVTVCVKERILWQS